MSTVTIGAAKKPLPWGWLVAALGLVAGLTMVFVVFRSQTLVDTRFDLYKFGAMGKSLARGEGFLPFGTLVKRRAPLYPLMIAGIYKVFGENPRLVQLVQCLLLAGTCGLVYDLGRRVFNRRTGIVAGVLVALHPMVLRYVPDFHLEVLFTFMVTLLIWLTVRFHELPNVRRGALLGVVAGLTVLTKAVMLPYPAIFAAGMWLTNRKAPRSAEQSRSMLAGLAVMFVMMLCTISPWTIRNYQVTGHFVPVSSGLSDAYLRGLVFSRSEFALLQKPPYTDAENESNEYFRQVCRRAGVEWEKEDYETDQVLNREAKARFFAEPGEFVRKFFVGLFTFWYEMTSFANSLLAFVLAVGAWALAAVGLRRAVGEGRPAWLFLAPVLCLNLFLAALLALGRYSVPVLPALLVLSAFGIDSLLARRKVASESVAAR